VLIEETARAKVNLTLQVLGRRPDGYHQLASVVAFASVGDVITLNVGPTTGVTVSGPFSPQLPTEILVTRTLELLRAHEPRLVLGTVHLDKRLPIAAGIGGGSADAAAVLRAARRANPNFAGTVAWHALAAKLGADVPVCLANTLTFMTGLGDVLHVMPALAVPLAAVLVNPRSAVPADKTAQIFRALQAPPLPPGKNATDPPRIRDSGDVVTAITTFGNDLETAASSVMPAVGDVLTALRAMPGCQAAAMSGSGPTCYGLFRDADAAAATLRAAHPAWWIEAVTLS
jgi:4-diphosphocytidyl-2-C-methyl-D-erythritol kinase